jgi:hypothetical protein
MWNENYGCGGTADCVFSSSTEGAVRFIVKPTTGAPQLSTDLLIDPSQTRPPIVVDPSVTNPTPTANSNPIKSCNGTCPPCSNNLSSKVNVFIIL